MDNRNDPHSSRWLDERLALLGPAADWRPDTARALARLREGQVRIRAVRRRWILLTAGLAASSAGLLAFPAPRALAQRIIVPCVEACAALFTNTAGGAATAAQTAPDFRLTDAAGASIRLSDYKGKVVLLNFWATWCRPCVAEIPWFIEFERTYRDQGFAVIGVSLDEDGWKSVRPYIDAAKVNYRIAVGDDALARRFGGIESLPETLLIDREGRIAARHVGIVSKGDYEDGIRRLLAN